MDITFRTKKLERLANDDRWRKKELGDLRARLFNLRLSQMLAAVTLIAVGPAGWARLKAARHRHLME